MASPIKEQSAAVDKALALERRNLRALILKADHLAAEGDERAASSYNRSGHVAGAG